MFLDTEIVFWGTEIVVLGSRRTVLGPESIAVGTDSSKSANGHEEMKVFAKLGSLDFENGTGNKSRSLDTGIVVLGTEIVVWGSKNHCSGSRIHYCGFRHLKIGKWSSGNEGFG